ncbi:DMT family transporter [Roseibium polysiphoniae]|uniref:DMT family transporter n=1 Tax=Roseibium polysiphoniae TaxID=2571221 RepID=A0ABR9C7S1_9HYPH|nr:DMT family transporter [Roseibium polysiphoniae]MBD8874972.1 DMT family transporter [Roseibium polysiphoniae]
METQNLRGGAEMTAAMLISGTIGWFVLQSGEPALQVVFWRCGFGALALLVVCWALGLFRRSKLTLGLFAWAALGGVAIVLNWALLFTSFSKASIAVSTVVYNTQPFMLTAIAMIAFGERPGLRKLGWLAIAFAGVVMIISTKPGSSYIGADYGLGIALALGAAALYAAAAAITKKLKGVPPHLIALIQVSVGVLMLAPFMSFAELPQTPGAWASLATLGVVHTGVMYVLLYGAIQKLPTTMVAALSYVYPIAAIVVDMVAFGTALQPIQILGSAAIILAAAGVSMGWPLLPRFAGRPLQPGE